LADPERAKKMGQAARETVKEKFSEERFINEWNTIFDKTYGVIK
jgi:glycosyltransferase involved in cell wall biosynthesis